MWRHRWLTPLTTYVVVCQTDGGNRARPHGANASGGPQCRAMVGSQPASQPARGHWGVREDAFRRVRARAGKRTRSSSMRVAVAAARIPWRPRSCGASARSWRTWPSGTRWRSTRERRRCESLPAAACAVLHLTSFGAAQERAWARELELVHCFLQLPQSPPGSGCIDVDSVDPLALGLKLEMTEVRQGSHGFPPRAACCCANLAMSWRAPLRLQEEFLAVLQQLSIDDLHAITLEQFLVLVRHLGAFSVRAPDGHVTLVRARAWQTASPSGRRSTTRTLRGSGHRPWACFASSRRTACWTCGDRRAPFSAPGHRP
jgi:hypothetical protein